MSFRLPARFWMSAAMIGLLAATSHAREIRDVTGATVKLVDHPQRVVTLLPSLGELAADILGERMDRIVGVSEYTDYPPALAKVRVVGPYMRFNLEQVAALKPDLVLASRDGNPKDQVDHLREVGIPVVVVDTENFSQVEQSMRRVGEALGESERGKRMADQFAAGLAQIRARAVENVRGQSRRRVLIQLNADPLVTIGAGAFLQDALEGVGAENVYSDQKTHYPRPSVEDVIRRAPEVILVLALGKDHSPFRAMAASWSQFPSLPAVKKQQIKVIQADTVVRPSLRLLEGLSLLEKAVYGPKTPSSPHP